MCRIAIKKKKRKGQERKKKKKKKKENERKDDGIDDQMIRNKSITRNDLMIRILKDVDDT